MNTRVSRHLPPRITYYWPYMARFYYKLGGKMAIHFSSLPTQTSGIILNDHVVNLLIITYILKLKYNITFV